VGAYGKLLRFRAGACACVATAKNNGFPILEVCMSLRWTIAVAALLAAGSVFAQNTQGGAPATATAQQGAAAQQQQKPPAPLTPADKPNLSYAIGFQIGNDFLERKIDVDINAVIKALQDGYAKRPPTVSEDTMRDVLQRMQYQVYSQAKSEFDKMAGDNKAKSLRFLAENKAKKGVTSLPSGVQYLVIEEGTGAKHPTLQSDVTVNFRSSLTSGLELDSSFARGEPFKFKVDSVIKGWQDVIPLMKVGDYWRIFVPPELAYGERGDGRRVGPNEVMVFEMKLMDTKP
jgi:FKBP-type peptidyl-prolyl cis-trans isomerase FklB